MLPSVCGVLLALPACNLEVPSSSYLSDTKLISVVVQVTELGPLNPLRVGSSTQAPIAEPMPHDRVAFDAVVVDADGERLPASAIETIWFQCGVIDCAPLFFGGPADLTAIDCSEFNTLDYVGTMDDVCRLGEGDGRFEFTVPELGQQLAEFRVAQYYGVVAWGDRSAESCWAARKASDADLDGCAFMQRSVKVGPSWWMLLYAEAIGLFSPIPIPQIAAGVLIQPANRIPIVSFSVEVDGAYLGTWPETTQFTAPLGARIEITGVYDELEQLLQSYFRAQRVGEPEAQSYVFTAAPEQLFETAFSSNAIHEVPRDFSDPGVVFRHRHEFVVDEYGEPETSRIWLVYYDDRYGEDIASFEFEVTR